MTTVSVVVATYNGAEYIEEQLCSIFSQSANISEIIVVDDCSTDNTLDVVRGLKDDRLLVKENSVNLGYIKNFERALSLASSDWVALCDQDDIWVSHKIESQLEFVSELNCDAVFSDALLVSFSGEELGATLSDVYIPKEFSSDGAIDFRSFYLANCVTGCTLMIRRKMLEKAIPFPSSVPHDWWLAYVAAAGNGVAYQSQCLVKYRQHEKNAIGAAVSQRKFSFDFLVRTLKRLNPWTLVRKKRVWHYGIKNRLEVMAEYEKKTKGSVTSELAGLDKWILEKINGQVSLESRQIFSADNQNSPIFSIARKRGFVRKKGLMKRFATIYSMRAYERAIILIYGLAFSLIALPVIF